MQMSTQGASGHLCSSIFLFITPNSTDSSLASRQSIESHEYRMVLLCFDFCQSTCLAARLFLSHSSPQWSQMDARSLALRLPVARFQPPISYRQAVSGQASLSLLDVCAPCQWPEVGDESARAFSFRPLAGVSEKLSCLSLVQLSWPFRGAISWR